MVSRKILIICLLVILAVIFFPALVHKKNTLAMPGFIKQTKITQSVPTVAPSVVPKTFQFDRSTDLKKELEKVNPQILDSDFE